MTVHALSVATLLVGWAATLSAQLISIRTVPVSQSHQFEVFPSRTLAMGGLAIAVRDTFLDPFSNPATGTRVGAARLATSPFVYDVSSQAGAGRALPFGVLGRRGLWFGGVSLALQQVDLSARDQVLRVPAPVPCPACGDAGIDRTTADRSRGNAYAVALVGRALPEAGVSVAGSVRWASLRAVDGVDLLYAGSQEVQQRGHVFDVRVGVVKEWKGDRSLEAVVVHNRFANTHDVLYLDTFWDPGGGEFAVRPRLEQNFDRTRTWGLHVEYERPLVVERWRVGWLATVNRMDHPKIPNYELMNIPRDPGYSTAFNVGMGLARSADGSTFGFEFVYEPIWSHTWADAAEPVTTRLGDVIPRGGMTIENRFRFSNAMFRMGVDRQVALEEPGAKLGFQFGLALRNIHYRLAQQNHVEASSRRQEEQWMEWTPTWGVSARFPDLEVRYRGAYIGGTGRPGVAPSGRQGVLDLASGGSNLLVAPSGPLTLTEVRVITHQIVVSVPVW